MTFRLTRRAEDDIIAIYRYTAETFGLPQADAYHDKLHKTFGIICDQSQLARERTEISPPVRVHPSGAHIIIYLAPPGEPVLIIRVRHASEDWLSDPVGTED